MFEKPYSYVLKTCPLFGYNSWAIIFEKCEIRILTGPEHMVEDMVGIMNTAWNIGFYSGKIVGEQNNV